MRKVRTLIVDDEPLARARVRKLLDKLPYIQVAASCKNGNEAWEKISTYRPDLVLLDVQMPDIDGFEVMKRVDFTPAPFVIFITAFDRYALQAFDVHAIDYLLKPYDDDRFYGALEHALKQIRLKQKAVLHEKMVHMIDAFQTDEKAEEDGIRLKEKDRVLFVHNRDIVYLESFGNYVKIHTLSRTHLYRHTLHSLENRLDRRCFLRIHRSFIVNANFIRNADYLGNNQYTIILKNDRELVSSRSYRNEIQAFLTDLEINRKLS